MNQFHRNIQPFVAHELEAAATEARRGQHTVAFFHLERAHVLGQASTIEHIRVHWRMFVWGLRVRDVRECFGQVLRIAGAATKTAFGLVPYGNTGGANVSPFKRMAVSTELETIIQRAKQPARST